MNMEAKVGTLVSFDYNGDRYEREIEDITIYKNYSWIGDLGWGGNVSFLIHGDLNDGRPVMQGLVIQVDGVGTDVHGYIKDIEFDNN